MYIDSDSWSARDRLKIRRPRYWKVGDKVEIESLAHLYERMLCRLSSLAWCQSRASGVRLSQSQKFKRVPERSDTVARSRDMNQHVGRRDSQMA